MSAVRQILAVTTMSLLSIPRRAGSSLVIVIGIAGVVAVLVSVLALATSFTRTAAETGRIDRAIVLNRGAESEAASGFARETLQTILNAPGIKRDPGAGPIASAETLAMARLTNRRTGTDAFATLRGVGPEAFALRPEIRIVEGRVFKPGLRELIVGRAAQRLLEGVEVGQHVLLPQGEWTVVGAFESNGDTHESELLTSSETLLSAFERNFFNSVTVMLESPDKFDAFKAALTSNPAVSVDVKGEREYFTQASKAISTLLRIIAYVIGGIMGFGAIIAALNTMYSAVSARSTEIATLRAIGYGGGAVVTSVVIEALVLSLIGAAAGATIAWVFFNGNSVSTASGTSPASVTFSLHIDPGLIATGIICACVIGIIGGLFPAIRAARLSVAAAIRGA